MNIIKISADGFHPSDNSKIHIEAINIKGKASNTKSGCIVTSRSGEKGIPTITYINGKRIKPYWAKNGKASYGQKSLRPGEILLNSE